MLLCGGWKGVGGRAVAVTSAQCRGQPQAAGRGRTRQPGRGMGSAQQSGVVASSRQRPPNRWQARR
eukprot:1980262-Alexandrium_andersonii.AAC.1